MHSIASNISWNR